MLLFIALPEDMTMNCYLHNISDVKNATGLKKKYLNCIVQGSDKPVGQFAFHPKKGPSFKQFQQQKVLSNLRIISKPIA